MESRLALALALSLGILVGFQVLFPPQKPESAPPGAAAPTSVASPAPADPFQVGTVPAAESAVSDPGFILEVRAPLYKARFASRGGRLAGFELTGYRKDPHSGSGPYDLVHANGALPLALLWRSEAGAIVDDRSVLYEITSTAGEVQPGQSAVVTMKGRTSAGATITKTLVLPGDSYLLDFKVTTEGFPATPLAVGWSRQLHTATGRSDVEGAVGYFDNTLESFVASTMEETEVVEGKAAWAGYAEHYFLAAFVPRDESPLKLVASAAEGAGHAALWTAVPATGLDYGLYVGPKSFEELEKADASLVHAIDLGWFWFVAKPLFLALRMIEAAVGNYGWAIILLTVAVRVAFYPVNQKQMEAMKGMQRIQPEVKKLQERFANDREKMNAEMMELYRRHKVNPRAGCLPMLIQLPVFIGLYNVLLQSIELRHAPFFGWMNDLSQPDRLGSLAIPFVEPAGIPVMTLLMGASMILQQKMTPSTADPAQQRIMMIMPVVFTVMFVNFPAGLVLYWLSNNVLSIGQQWLSNRQGK
ncbi:MAG: membrane protein insertase YidC [Candidatus Binatia bacterium]